MPSHKYEALEMTEKGLYEHDETSANNQLNSFWQRKLEISRALLVVMLLPYALILWMVISLRNGSVSCVKQSSAWSPMLQLFETDNASDVRFDGRFWTGSRFKGPPNAERDDAWEELASTADIWIAVSDEDRIKAGGPENSVRLPSRLGDGYVAGVEVTHQLHCLNMIRQSLYPEYYSNRSLAFTDSPATVKIHLEHCIDNLRQKLMCEADVGLIFWHWVEGKDKPAPDFNVQHKCRNYDKAMEWVRSNEVDWTEEDSISVRARAISDGEAWEEEKKTDD